MILRRYTFKLYPTAAQAQVLDAQRQALGALYNGLLQQRIEAYQRCVNPLTGKGKTLTAFDQGKEITALRAADPAYATLSRGTLEQVVKRLDLAFKAFFKRAKGGAGAAAGFPRFQRTADYPSIPFREADKGGWKFELNPNLRHGRARFQAVPGWIKLRGKLPAAPLGVRTCEILFRGGVWSLSLVVELPAPQAAPARPAGYVAFDLVTQFAVVRQSNGGCPTGPEAVLSRTGDGRISLHFPGAKASPLPASPDLTGDDRSVIIDRTAAALPASPDLTGDDRSWVPQSYAMDLPASPDLTGDDRMLDRLRNLFRLPASPDLTGKDRGCALTQTRGEIPAAPDLTGDDRFMRFGGPELSAEEALQQAMARCQRGSYRYRKLRQRKARRQARQAAQRDNFLHNFSAAVARTFGDLTILAPPSIKAATESGRGSETAWGAAVAPKAGLNRHILGQAPASAIALLTYKIEQQGGRIALEKDPAPPVAVGAALVATTKAARTLKRTARKATAA